VTQTGAGVPDLSGGYLRIDSSGSGHYGGLTSAFPRAQLTPAAATAPAGPGRGGPESADDDRDITNQRNAPGVPYVVTGGRCGGPGVPLEYNSAAFFLLQTPTKVIVTRESAGTRHIWMDGRARPDASRWIPTNTGYSLGRYENGDLVIETMGLTPGVVTAGGRRTPETKLTERYHLVGNRLTITYTWEDPKLYVKPHSYSLVFEKLPSDAYALEAWCDASDPEFSYGITTPLQTP
jgi:hypothetical protein